MLTISGVDQSFNTQGVLVTSRPKDAPLEELQFRGIHIPTAFYKNSDVAEQLLGISTSPGCNLAPRGIRE